MNVKRMILAALAAGAAASQLAQAEEEVDAERAANLVILDEAGVKNLRIKTVEVDEQDFETTVFAIGRIEEIPANRSVLSSRISGRAIRVHAFEGDHVEEGQVLVDVESRQPGNPPPTISLKASQSGLIIASHVRVGQPVEPEAELLDISDRSEMWATARIPEKEASTMKLGTEARIVVHALGGEPIVAELTRFGIEADRTAGTVEGIFKIANPDGRLQPGMRAEFSIITGRRSNVMAVPRAAVQGDPAKRVVYVKDFDLPNAFLRFPVILGEQNDQYVEVVSGYDLRLMSVSASDKLPGKGRALVIVALVGGKLHLRIFDTTGELAIDLPEDELDDEELISELKGLLNTSPFPDAAALSHGENQDIIKSATLVADHVLPGLFPSDEVVTQGSYSLGFAGAGSVSLKEALDAAHGHEHAEDGSELTPAENAAKQAEASGQTGGGGGVLNTFLMIYSGVATLLFIGAAQMLWSKRKEIPAA